MILIEQQMLEFLNNKVKFYTFIALVEYVMSNWGLFVLSKSKLEKNNQCEILSS